jgi:hypothetical protein
MCRRFATIEINVTGSSNDVGFGVAGECIGLGPGGMPQGGRPSVDYRHVTDVEAQLTDLTAAGAADEPHFSVFALSVDAL